MPSSASLTTQFDALSLHDALPILIRYVSLGESLMPSTGVMRIHFCASAEYSTLPIGESLSVIRMTTSSPSGVNAIAGAVLSTRKSMRSEEHTSASHANISYAVFCFAHHPVRRSFPTRRSSDLDPVRLAWRIADAVDRRDANPLLRVGRVLDFADRRELVRDSDDDVVTFRRERDRRCRVVDAEVDEIGRAHVCQSRQYLVCRLLLRSPPSSTLFPYTTLFRS